MTSSMPDRNIAKTPIYESLMATRGDPYQVDRPAGGWSLPAVSTDFGAANDILSRLLAQAGSDGQGWVAVVLVGGPAAAQLSQQLAQGTMPGLPGPFATGYSPLAAYQALQAMQALQNQGQPWSQPELPYAVTAQALPSPGMAAPPPAPLAFEAGPSGYQPSYSYQSYGDNGTIPAVTDDPIAASMASNMAAGIVRNALEASAPSGFMYDQYGSRPDPYAASALTPAPAYRGAMQANPLDSGGRNPVVPQPEAGMGGVGMGMAADTATPLYAAVQAQMQARAQAQLETSGQYSAVPMMGQPDLGMMPGSVAGMAPGYPGYPTATYAAMGRPAGGREGEEDSADGRVGRFTSAVRALRRR